jgi:iron complex outermembrane receptor protein
MTNATNQKYQAAITTSYVSAGFESLIMAPPRMWGVRAKFRFGE